MGEVQGEESKIVDGSAECPASRANWCGVFLFWCLAMTWLRDEVGSIESANRMFHAYIDESSDTNNAVFAVGGFAGRTEEWTVLEPLWLDALPNGIEYFHATDCFSRCGQFKDIDIPERVALLDRLTDLVLEAKIWLVAGVMDVPAYQAISPKRLENEFLGNK